MSDAKHWKRENANPNPSRFWWSLVIGWTIGALLIALLVGFYKKQPTLPDIKNAKTIFVVAQKPSPKLLKQLKAAHDNGAHVQIVTATPVETPYKNAVVAKEKIIKNALLLNGSEWYALP